MKRNDKIEFLAKALYKCDYPAGGSVYPDWDSIPEHDKRGYMLEGERVLLVNEGKAVIKVLSGPVTGVPSIDK